MTGQGQIVDPGLAELEAAGSDEERMAIEARLLAETDNRPRPDDGAQPDQEGGHRDVLPRGPAGPGPASVLARARGQLGVAESPPGSNRVLYSDWYGLRGPWCAMFVSWVFFHEGLPLPATAPRGFAYTPSGAAWFKREGRWHTSRPQPGDLVFFDFPGDGVNRISHVGIVEQVMADGSIHALEGNTDERGGRTGGKVMRRARRVGIVGYGRPPWPAGTAGPAAEAPTEAANVAPVVASGTTDGFKERVMALPVLRRGDTGHHVRILQGLMIAHGAAPAGVKVEEWVDGEFGEGTERELKAWQGRTQALPATGVCDGDDWGWLIGV